MMAVRLLKFAKRESFFYTRTAGAVKVYVANKYYIAPALDCKVATELDVHDPHKLLRGTCEGLYITDTLITIY